MPEKSQKFTNIVKSDICNKKCQRYSKSGGVDLENVYLDIFQSVSGRSRLFSGIRRTFPRFRLDAAMFLPVSGVYSGSRLRHS